MSEIGDIKKVSDEYKPVVLDESLDNYTKDFQYGATIQQLRPGIEVKRESNSGGLKKIGHFQITATGDIPITGIGFTPTLIQIISNISGGTGAIKSVGFCDGTNTHTNYDYNTATGLKSYYSNNLIYLEDGSTGSFLNMTGNLVSFDSDGFTVNISNKTLLGNGECTYIVE